MARIYPPTHKSASDVRKRAADAVSHAHERTIDPIKDRLFAMDQHETVAYRPMPTRANRNYIEGAGVDPEVNFGGGEITQSFKVLHDRLMGLSNGLTVLAQRIDSVVRPEPPATAGKDTAGPSASTAVGNAVRCLDRDVESMQSRIDSLTERIVL